ncbi:TetR/AcrR family transcriptional regulator [Novosphingobium sp.]|uniref:TetR/AcrR family transcriptional regulator n=1 Tax=Novosphingobium sp. TaxID=1874826 RepID=UPI0038BB5312
MNMAAEVTAEVAADAIAVPDFERAKPPVQDRAHRTKERLLDVAGAMLGDVGIERISTNLVAQAAGVTPPALYRHFRNKYDLLAALAERLMQRQNDVLIDWLDRWSRAGQPGLPPDLTELFRETARITDSEPGGVWIERAMRAVPQLAPIRIASHRYVTDRIVAAMMALTPDQDARVLWRRVRLAVEIGYAVDEMLHEEDRITAEDLFGDAARAIAAITAAPISNAQGDADHGA